MESTVKKKSLFSRFLRIFLWLCAFGLFGLILIFAVGKYVQKSQSDKIQTSMTEIPVEEPPRIAIVLGAKVWEDGSASPVLYDRVLTAVELYRAGRVKKLLMSGDNPTAEYDEPTAMKRTAMELGVPESDIVLDFAGRRTYDTCWRAKEVFEVKRAIIVTQEFHQARSLYLCNNLGVDSIGITSNRRQYLGERRWAVREFFSLFGAWFEMNFYSFDPIGGEKEPIKQ